MAPTLFIEKSSVFVKLTTRSITIKTVMPEPMFTGVTYSSNSNNGKPEIEKGGTESPTIQQSVPMGMPIFKSPGPLRSPSRLNTGIYRPPNPERPDTIKS